MKILINGKEFSSAESWGTAGELFDLIGAQPEWQSGIITQVAIDGHPTVLPDPSGPFPPPDIEGEIIEFTVESVVEVLHRSLEDGATLLDMIRSQCIETADQIRGGLANEAAKNLSGLLDRISLFMDYISEVLRFVESSFEGFEASDNIEEFLSKSVAISKSILASQEKEDYVSLADLLEYELAPHIENWREFITGDDFNIKQ